MKPRKLPPFINHCTVSIIIISFAYSACYCAENEYYRNCSKKLECGSMTGIGYPYWGNNVPQYCGGGQAFELKCVDDQYLVMEFGDLTFRVLEINDDMISLARSDIWGGPCGAALNISTALNYDFFDYVLTDRNISLFYDCKKLENVDLDPKRKFTCHNGQKESIGYYSDEYSAVQVTCAEHILVPVLRWAREELFSETLTLQEALNKGFYVNYFQSDDQKACSKCQASNGLCGFNLTSSKFLCFCPNDTQQISCHSEGIGNGSKDPKGTSSQKTAMVGVSNIFITMGVLVACAICAMGMVVLWKRKMIKPDENVDGFTRHYASMFPKRYNFLDIKKMTNSFEDKLGEGGYGCVYKGKLQDGRLVAVKVIQKSKESGEEFINEVVSISRTSHINIVSLVGFCFEGSKRALIFEYMPNGSLEKFIYHRHASPEAGYQHLGWEKLYRIAIGIARGLEYLHRGCVTPILHFDIKPHNILLDEDFCPKISDFGLAKLCSRKASYVSMLDARGTVGYIAPEVFSRNFGAVSHKSDVYSYGMMVLEMVGGRKNMDLEASHSSEMYFPRWAYDRLQQENSLGLHDVLTVVENEIVKKMILVGFWCIQPNPQQRPSMKEVIEMLEGRIEDLQMPPKPFISSPPISQSLLISTSTS